MKYNVIVRQEEGWYIAECPTTPGCVTQGKILKEVKENIKDAMIGCLEVLNRCL